LHKNIIQERIKWFLLACFGFVSSLQRYEQPQWGIIAPPLVFPLEPLRANGRPLAIAFLGLLLLIAFATKRWGQKISMPPPILYLGLVQIVIWVKTVEEGDPLLGSVIFAIFSAVVFMHLRGPAQWIYDERTLRLGFWAIAMVGVIFVVVNLYQWRVDPVAINYVQGWFHGTTGNPHHAGVLMTVTMPSVLALIATSDKRNWQQVLWLILLIILLFLLYKTASRTSFVMFFVSAAIVFRYNLKKSVGIVIFSALIVLTLYTFFEPTTLQTSLGVGTDDATISKLALSNNTRGEAWSRQWSNFTDNIVFGAPLRGDRMRFEESSWLGSAAGLGLMGFVPMILFGISTIQLMLKLDRVSKCYSTATIGIYSNAIIAALASLLVGASSEAFLLANLNFSLYVTLQYLILGQFLLDSCPVVPRQLNRLPNAYSGDSPGLNHR
jgi:hypothetical protein